MRKEIYNLRDKIEILKDNRERQEIDKDKEIDMLQQDIQQLINRCMILNKDEMTATARVLLGRDIVLRFRKLLQENKQQADIIKNSISKDKLIERIERNNKKIYGSAFISTRYENKLKMENVILQELLEGDE